MSANLDNRAVVEANEPEAAMDEVPGVTDAANAPPPGPGPTVADTARVPVAFGPVPSDGFWKFVSSGLFFMLVGAAFLATAAGTLGKTHAGMTFVFVVVGVALLLYGTGTQSVGSFETGDKATEAKVKVRLAGGAGVLAFAAAAGIIFFTTEINRAFREETRFLEVLLVGAADGQSNLENYLAEAEIAGVPIPITRRGKKYIVALVPYTSTNDSAIKQVDVRLAWGDKTKPLGNLEPEVSVPPIRVDVGSRKTGTDGLAFDISRQPPFPVKLTKVVNVAGGAPADRDDRFGDPVAPGVPITAD